MSDAFNVVGAGRDLASELLTTAQSILQGAGTSVGTAIEINRSDAFTAAEGDGISVYVPLITREWLGGTPVQFRTTCQLVLVAMIYRDGDTTLESDTDQLRVQIENALFCSPVFRSLPLERIASVDTEITFQSATSPYQGQIRMVLHCECTETFGTAIAPISGATPVGAIGVPFAEAATTIESSTGTATLTGANIIIPT